MINFDMIWQENEFDDFLIILLRYICTSLEEFFCVLEFCFYQLALIAIV